MSDNHQPHDDQTQSATDEHAYLRQMLEEISEEVFSMSIRLSGLESHLRKLMSLVKVASTTPNNNQQSYHLTRQPNRYLKPGPTIDIIEMIDNNPGIQPEKIIWAMKIKKVRRDTVNKLIRRMLINGDSEKNMAHYI